LLQVIKKVYNFCQKYGRDHLENLGTYGMDIKTELKEQCDSVGWMNLPWDTKLAGWLTGS
jgi:hypothetical protein